MAVASETAEGLQTVEPHAGGQRGRLPGAESAATLRRGRKIFARLLYAFVNGTSTLVTGLFGAACLILGLALLAATPVLQFAALGYLLEASGRIVRTGSFAAGWIGVRRAAHLGGWLLGTAVVLAPLWLLRSLADSAQLIDPGGTTAHRWQGVVTVVAVLTAYHLVTAWARGGRLRHFLVPVVRPRRVWRALRTPGAYGSARDRVWDFLSGLRLPYYWWLGLRGFLGALAWLVVPTTLLALGQQSVFLGYAGAFALAWVAIWLPLAQAHFAAKNRLRAMFALGELRTRARHAPWLAALATIATLVLAVPLYLLKIELVPREAAWLPSLAFVVFMWPAHMLAGWAWASAVRRPRQRWAIVRWPARALLVPVALAYVGIVWFSQFTAWYGVGSLYEQHAFLLPVPFLNLGE
ncbi:MAG: DUF4013 domain-containing protein [Pirellulales bacterium]|nr:DUF4013 domain-containing protein [Pirellulales bacterium]